MAAGDGGSGSAAAAAAPARAENGAEAGASGGPGAPSAAAAPPQTATTTSVYVTGLPEDCTVDEVAEEFSRVCGIIREDDDGCPKVKLYRCGLPHGIPGAPMRLRAHACPVLVGVRGGPMESGLVVASMHA